MKNDMTKKMFEPEPFGQVALQKLGKVNENFRLYHAQWLENGKGDVMKVTGAEFRKAKRGPNKGKMVIMVKGTTRTVYVTKQEIQDFENARKRARRMNTPGV